VITERIRTGIIFLASSSVQMQIWTPFDERKGACFMLLW